MLIQKVSADEMTLIDGIVDIHLQTFQGFFLTFMGKGFLRQMYQSYVEHQDSNILVALEDRKVIGFLAYSANMSDLYKYMIKHKVVKFAWYSVGAFFRKPKVFMRILRAFLKPGEAKREEAYIELASIGVDPKHKSQGVGTALIDELKRNLKGSRYAYITLETDTLENERAISFYEKNGFFRQREFCTAEKRKMIEFRYKGI